MCLTLTEVCLTLTEVCLTLTKVCLTHTEVCLKLTEVCLTLTLPISPLLQRVNRACNLFVEQFSYRFATRKG